VKKEVVAVLGLGYVGLPLALLADRKGYMVYGIDLDAKKVKSIQKKESPFLDQEVEKYLQISTMTATTDMQKIKEADIIIICVPTPVSDGYRPDLTYVESALSHMAPYLKEKALVILESTVNPGISEEVVLPSLEEKTGLKCGKDFYLAHCPERINPGDEKWNVENIPRVVGSVEHIGLQKASKFYRSLITGSVKEMESLKEAEAVKVVENTFRDINIAFVNELAVSFSHLGINVKNVIDGAATKPFAFLPHYPGCGVGGHCIPVDPYYLIEYASKNGFDHRFLKLSREINNSMPRFTVSQMEKSLKEKNVSVKNSIVAVLGISYKANIDDHRESPFFRIIEELKKSGAKVVTFDPFVPKYSSEKSLSDALEKANGIIVATPHNVFQEITPALLADKSVSVIIDGRNMFSGKEFLEKGIVYKGIGT
jgi:nucleotide sugar dehydrogenase